MSKSVQFPIDQSLPFILVKHIVEQKSDASTANGPTNLLYALEIYNDAANVSLQNLKCAFLFDEVEVGFSFCLEEEEEELIFWWWDLFPCTFATLG